MVGWNVLLWNRGRKEERKEEWNDRKFRIE